MAKQGKAAGVLRRDKEYVKFVQLLRRAERDGRLDGTHTCTLCGMKFQTRAEAKECCRVTIAYVSRVSIDAEYDRENN